MKPTHLIVWILPLAIVSGCADNASSETDEAVYGEEQDLTQAPYLEVVNTPDAQGKKIVAHGLPAVSRTTNTTGTGSYVQAALLLETPYIAMPGYVGFRFDVRDRIGSYTGSDTPLLAVDSRTSPPTVIVRQSDIDRINAQLKKDHWSRFIEHAATNNTVNAGFGWRVTYDGAAAKYPKLHVHRAGNEILKKGASYYAQYAFGPQGCTYTPELASAAISTKHKALLLRVHYETADADCSIVDRYFTESLP